MEEHILRIITTGLGAMSGAYCAYRLAERNLRRSEKEKFLTLILIVLEHIEHVRQYLDKFDIAKDGETNVNLAIFKEPFYAPPITEKNIEALMELSTDKNMPRCLIQMNYFFKKMEEGTHSDNHFFIPFDVLNPIREQLQDSGQSLLLLYEQERGDNRKFPPLPDKIFK